MKPRRILLVGVMLLTIIATRAWGPPVFETAVDAQGQQSVEVPIFEFDVTWPKPLLETWAVGPVVGVAVDSRDHIWIAHRRSVLLANPYYTALVQSPPIGECCEPAPPILEFDQAGNLVSSWGGPGDGYEWPQSEHGIFIDHNDYVWTGGNGAKDAQILKFTKGGKFVLQIGRQGNSGGNDDPRNLRRPADITVDPTNNEVYVADGYGNRRVIVFDADTGAFKRLWGAYGNRPEDADIGGYNPDAPPAQQFRTVHAVIIADDGLVYVADRANDRVQAFRKDGTFIREVFISRRTILAGSVNDVALSRDPQQRYLYVLDGVNHRLWILLRESLQIVGRFGRQGHWAGQFDHSPQRGRGQHGEPLYRGDARRQAGATVSLQGHESHTAKSITLAGQGPSGRSSRGCAGRARARWDSRVGAGRAIRSWLNEKGVVVNADRHRARTRKRPQPVNLPRSRLRPLLGDPLGEPRFRISNLLHPCRGIEERMGSLARFDPSDLAFEHLSRMGNHRSASVSLRAPRRDRSAPGSTTGSRCPTS